MRSAVVSNWLAQTDWSKWARRPMTGDASTRRYERLMGPSDQSVILMDAPPETCGNQSRFTEIAAHLHSLNLVAPQVLAFDEVLGLMVLEDLGQIDFATHLNAAPQDEGLLYQNAVVVLRALQSAPPPSGLTTMTADVGADMIDLAFEWATDDVKKDLRAEIKGQLRDLLHRVDPNPGVLSLRDFHAQNLIWRPRKNALAQVGLLDFQDAFITHPVYDLASLLRDARRDVDPTLVEPLIKQMAAGNADLTTFTDAFHVMALQRNLRILGIFRRLAHQGGKTGYLTLLPRVQNHLREDLSALICEKIAIPIRRAFPELDLSP